MIENLLKKIAIGLDEAKIPYMIIGGQAVLVYGSPRLTRDIDITLGIDTDKFTLIKKLCEKLAVRILSKNPRDFVQQTKVLPTEDKTLKIRIDFIFSFTPYERQAIKRIKKIMIDGYPVKFASPEDVIIHKMFAGRAIDEEDVKNIITKRKEGLNIRYIKKWLLEFDKLSFQKGILKKFQQIYCTK